MFNLHLHAHVFSVNAIDMHAFYKQILDTNDPLDDVESLFRGQENGNSSFQGIILNSRNFTAT